jgi:hypothetical protein
VKPFCQEKKGTYHNNTQINSKVLQYGFSIKTLMRGEHGKIFCYKEATKCGHKLASKTCGMQNDILLHLTKC